VDDLLRLEDLGQAVEPLVGHLDRADVELQATVAAGVGMAPGQGVEDGRLAGGGEADDGDLHAPDSAPTGEGLWAVEARSQYPAPVSRR
jgi:hypothetical protein